MPIVTTVTGRALPGIYVLQVDPPPQANTNISTGVGVLVAAASWGPINEVTQIGSLGEYRKLFGTTLDGYGQAFGFFSGGEKSDGSIKGGGSDLRMIRINGTGLAYASVDLVDDEETPGVVGTYQAKYKGARGNDIQVECVQGDTTFDLTIIPFDGLPAETFTGLTAATAAAAINGVSAYGTWEDGASTALPVDSTAFLAGGSDGTHADADYVGVAGPPATGLELAKTVTDANFVWTGKMSAAVKTAVAAAASDLNGLTVVDPNSETVTTSAALAEQTFDSVNVLYHYSYIEWLNPETGDKETVFPAGDIIGGMANGEYYLSATGMKIRRALRVVNPVSETTAETLCKAGINVISATKKGLILRSNVNTSTDKSKNQDFDTRIRTFLARAIDESLGPQWTKSFTDEWYERTEALLDQVFNDQPDEVIRRKAGQPGHAVAFDKSFEAQDQAIIYIQAIICGKALQIIVKAQIGRSVELTFANAA